MPQTSPVDDLYVLEQCGSVAMASEIFRCGMSYYTIDDAMVYWEASSAGWPSMLKYSRGYGTETLPIPRTSRYRENKLKTLLSASGPRKSDIGTDTGDGKPRTESQNGVVKRSHCMLRERTMRTWRNQGSIVRIAHSSCPCLLLRLLWVLGRLVIHGVLRAGLRLLLIYWLGL